MNHLQRTFRRGLLCVAASGLLVGVLSTGCTTMEYRDKRFHGQNLMIGGGYGAARHFFEEAETIKPRRVENLHDLGTCSVMLARQRFEEKNQVAAMRELDSAVRYYSHALEVFPGHQASIEGKNIALELKGQFDEALEHAEWTVEFVGPAAKQYIFLAQENEQRGDIDSALLRYRQAVAMEPKNAAAHISFAKFLLRTGNDEAAVFHLKKAYHLDPTDSWTLGELASRGAVPSLEPEGVSKR